jgi:AcrR family transcriptional regulator
MRVPKTPRAPKPDDTRNRLLRAAAEVFAQEGYDAATVREICKRASTNVSMVKYHFGDKLELYSQVLKHAVHRQEPPQNLEAAGTIEDKLGQLIRVMLDRILEGGDQAHLHYRLMSNEMVRPSEATELVITIAIRPVYGALCGLIAAALRRNVDDTDVRLCVHSLLGQLAHYAHSRGLFRALWPKLTFTEKDRDRIARHISDMLCEHLELLRSRTSDLVKPPASTIVRKNHR